MTDHSLREAIAAEGLLFSNRSKRQAPMCRVGEYSRDKSIPSHRCRPHAGQLKLCFKDSLSVKYMVNLPIWGCSSQRWVLHYGVTVLLRAH